MPFKEQLTLSMHTNTHIISEGVCVLRDMHFFGAKPTDTLFCVKHQNLDLGFFFLFFFCKFDSLSAFQKH